MTPSSSFLADGGEMGALMRARDWAATPLGTPDTWPQSLRSTLSICLNSPLLGTVLWGDDLLMLYNDAYIPSMGERHPGALATPVAEVWGSAWEQVAPPFGRAMETGEGFSQENVELSIMRRGRLENTVWNYSAAPIRGEDGRIVGLFNQGVEITEQVRTQQRIVSEAQRHRDVLMQMPGFVGVLKGEKHVYEFVNDAYERIAGSRPLLGLTVREAFPELQGQGFYELLDRVYATGEPFSAQAMSIRLAGETHDRFIDFLYDPVRDDQGNVIGILVGGYEVTERIVLEAALREAQTTLEQRVEERSAELLKAEEALRQSQKMEAVGQLTGGLAHDFNNMLAGITGSLELVRKRAAEGRLSEIDRYVTLGLGAAKRAASLTHRLLAFSRRQTLDPKPVRMNRLVAGMEEMIRRTVGPQIDVQVVAAEALRTVLADSSQLENALLNLCINARDAMPAGGTLTIETANRRIDERTALEGYLSEGAYVSLCVSDNGVGMPLDVVTRAFDPFFTTKPIGMGTGLGLSMIYGFAKQSGGHARIDSTVGRGTAVSIDLPAHFGDVALNDEKIETPEAPQASHGQTVLVVDDDATIRGLLNEVMVELGYSTILAADGPAALEVLQSDVRIDLLVTDVGLPGGINGRQVADGGRTVRPTLKVLFITGYAENAVLSHGHLGPGMHVLTKPFELDAMAGRVKELIEDA